MKHLFNFSRILVGLIFIYSGFVKGVDPVGSVIKFHDYFQAFGLTFLDPVSMPLAILMNITELLIGITLVLGVNRNISIWSATLFMGFFTILTFFLAIYNPVSDCGCFGDALIMTNWQTFYKNMAIMPFIVILFVKRNQFKSEIGIVAQWSISTISAMAGLLLSLYCLNHLPILDFRPYNVGTHIPLKMKIPENAEPDVYETKMFYEKDGVTKEFTLENYPWEDTTWKFVDQKSILIKKGYEPPIHDFSIESPEEDITESILNDENYTFAFISHDINKANKKASDKIVALQEFCSQNNFNFIGLSSSASETIDNFKTETGIEIPFYNTDQTTLKTIIRSNPGFLLLQKGTIIGKWHYKDLPDTVSMSEHLQSYFLSSLQERSEKQTVWNIFLMVCFLILFGRNLLLKRD